MAEVLVTSCLGRSPVREWRRTKGVRGGSLDSRVYAFAALQALISMGLSLNREAERIEALASRTLPQAVPPVAQSSKPVDAGVDPALE